MRTTCGLGAAAVVVSAYVTVVYSCMVPVFRYALERWPADPYRVVVFHEGDLTTAQKAEVEALRSLSGSDNGAGPVAVGTVDTSDDVPGELSAAWESFSGRPLPLAAAFFPAPFPMKRSVWSGPLAGAAGVLGRVSPAQAEIARRLTKGESAVWLFVGGGDAEMDASAHDALVAALREAEDGLKLPHELDPEDTEYDHPLAHGVELRIAFSTLRLRQDDPEEALLMEMLNGLVGDETPRPFAAPVFGRGRALTALTREMLTHKAVREIGKFLVGPCSCQAKAANPGVDLLIPVDWEGMLEGSAIPEVELPPLTVPTPAPSPEGAPARVEADASAPPGLRPSTEAPQPGEHAVGDSPSSPMQDDAPASGGLARNIVILAILAAALVTAATAVVVLRNRKATP